jgi:ABC-type lipoprotein release transport system permease subunit
MLAWHLGLRYLRRRRAAWLALAAITLTVAAPVAVIGVTQGFLDVLQKQARANESDVTVQEMWGDSGMIDVPEARAEISEVPGVAALAPFVQLFALMSPRDRGAHPSLGIPCQIDGVDWASDDAIGRLDPRLLHPQPAEDLSAPLIPPDERGSGLLTPAWREQLCLLGLASVTAAGVMPAPLPPSMRPPPGVVAGRELLYGCGVHVGDRISLVGAAQVKQLVEISDTIGTGILEVDKFEMLTPLPVGQAIADFGATTELPARVDGYRVKAAPGTDLDHLARALRVKTGEPALTWMRRRLNMVKSLEYQRNIMALVMLAIQTIAVFVVYAVFSTMVAEKRHDIGVLLGIGARPAQIAGAFLIAGVAACLFGGLLGWGIGWAVMWGLRVLSKDYGILLFPQDVFYSPDTPISWDPRIPLVFIGAMALIGLAAVTIPALRAARIQPVDILREGG